MEFTLTWTEEIIKTGSFPADSVQDALELISQEVPDDVECVDGEDSEFGSVIRMLDDARTAGAGWTGLAAPY